MSEPPLLPHLRDATADDAAALASLAERTFRDAFSSQNTPDDIAAHCAASFGPELQAAEIANPAMETIVVETPEPDAALIAYAQLRWGEAPECVSAAKPVEILRIYVDRSWHGRGVAQRLMDELFARAAAGGADAVWLGVWEHNPRAIAFYEKSGFTLVGDHRFLLGSDPQRDLVFVRAPEPL